MAQNTTITLEKQTWTELTNADVARITAQNVGSSPIFLKASTSAPTDPKGAIVLYEGLTILNEQLADLWPGVTAARVWAYGALGGSVMVSHA